MGDIPQLGVPATVFACPDTSEPVCDDHHGEVDDAHLGQHLMTMDVVSCWFAHVALYALQVGTPLALARARRMLACSGDINEHVDGETLLPLPVPKPSGWDDAMWDQAEEADRG